MDELDMSGVDPLRWAEIRRRVAVIESYLAIPSPTEAERRAHAAQLNRSSNQFMALVRSWRDHRSAVRIAASGAHRGGTRGRSRLSIDPLARQVTADAIDELGPDTTLAATSNEVRTRCEAEGVPPPSDSTIWNMVRATRRSRGTDATGVVIGTCMVQLPVMTGHGLCRPMLTLAVRAVDKAIVAASLDEVDWTAAAIAIAASRETGAVTIDRDLIGPNRHIAPDPGVTALAGAKVRSAMSRILGTGIGELRLIYRPGKAVAAERLLTTREDRPLSPADARTVINAAVARHNASVGASHASWINAASPSPPASGG